MNIARSLVWLGLMLVVGAVSEFPVFASTPLGSGNSSLLGGDLTDPTDSVVDTGVYDPDKSEDELRPPKATWSSMRSAPNSPPGTIPHQRHAYQSWQGSPACAIFLNKPDSRKWYVSFIDGGNGGPTDDDPFYCAVELKKPHVLTHFTITAAGEMPDRDPRQWAIQGSNSGDDDDWTDIYRCDAKSRVDSPFQASSRLQTVLFTSFKSENMAKSVSADDLTKLEPRLKGRQIDEADFTNSGKAYTWFRIVVYSCFNPNSTKFRDFNRPPGFSLGQLELFGIPGKAGPIASKARAPRVRLTADQLVKPESYDPAFIIMPWVGPPKTEVTLERFKELVDCGFNVSFPPQAGENDDGPEVEKFNRKYLDICQQVGIKALVWDGLCLTGRDLNPDDKPKIEKALDTVISRYSTHPALLGYYLADEPGPAGFAHLGFMNQYLLQKDPKHLPYINLLPAYAFNPRSSYEVYVAKYLETVKPALVSWDHYRQMFEGGDESTYWYNLELMRKQCGEKRLPFNQIIVSNKHMGYRECSEVDLRWQVFTSLAYGSRGIQYFTYWFTPGLAWADAPALISKEGKRDVKWNYVQKINRHIGKLGPTLAKLTSTGAYCTPPIPPGAKKLPSTAPVKKAEGGTFAIGCFQDPAGKQYVMVVNRAFNSVANVKLTMNERITSVAEISQETGMPKAAQPTAKKQLAFELEPGDGKLFMLNETGLFYNPPEEIYGGRAVELTGIEFEPQKPENVATGKFHWRAAGAAQFASLPLVPTDSTHFKVALTPEVSKSPFEYYLEIQEPGEAPVLEPEMGAAAPIQVTPDLNPPSAVPEVVASLAKSYRVVVDWKAATDDRSVSKYRVYRGDSDKFALDEKLLLATAEELKFSDDMPPSKKAAWYAVQPVDVVGREGEARYLRVDVPDHQPPDNQLTLKAVPGSKSVMLSWTGELEPIVDAVEIHRGEGAEGPLQKIAEVKDVKQSRYLDQDAKFGVQYRYSLRPHSKFGLLATSGAIASASPLRFLKRINCGGPEIPSDDGVAWESDKAVGHPALKSSGTSTWTVKESVPATGDAKAVYQTERWANRQIQYSFEVEPGRYEIVLHLAETNPSFFAKGKRMFDVRVNEEKIAEKLDVFAAAGGQMTPWQFRHTVEVSQPQLTIELAGIKNGPAIKALEVRGLSDKAEK